MMEEKLKKLFDYQRFQENERLSRLIVDTRERYSGCLSDDDLACLSDDDLALVSAAGSPELLKKPEDDPFD